MAGKEDPMRAILSVGLERIDNDWEIKGVVGAERNKSPFLTGKGMAADTGNSGWMGEMAFSGDKRKMGDNGGS